MCRCAILVCDVLKCMSGKVIFVSSNMASSLH